MIEIFKIEPSVVDCLYNCNLDFKQYVNLSSNFGFDFIPFENKKPYKHSQFSE